MTRGSGNGSDRIIVGALLTGQRHRRVHPLRLERPGPPLVYDDGFRARSYSYLEVGRAAREFASRSAPASETARTSSSGARNRPEWIVAFWGCLLGSVVVVPIN